MALDKMVRLSLVRIGLKLEGLFSLRQNLHPRLRSPKFQWYLKAAKLYSTTTLLLTPVTWRHNYLPGACRVKQCGYAIRKKMKFHFSPRQIFPDNFSREQKEFLLILKLLRAPSFSQHRLFFVIHKYEYG